MPDSSDLSGGDSSQVPTGMENDPNADEEVIRQDANNPSLQQDQYPEQVQEEDPDVKLAPDDLADSIAYALDGSGPGPTNAKPNVSGHDVITEGTSGAGPEEEERIFGK